MLPQSEHCLAEDAHPAYISSAAAVKMKSRRVVSIKRERDMGGGLGSGWGAILLSLLLIVENERTESERDIE